MSAAGGSVASGGGRRVLTKKYLMVDEEEPILEKSIGTEIDWLPGKNLCVKARAGATPAHPPAHAPLPLQTPPRARGRWGCCWAGDEEEAEEGREEREAGGQDGARRVLLQLLLAARGVPARPPAAPASLPRVRVLRDFYGISRFPVREHHQVPEDDEEMDDEAAEALQEAMENDYEMGAAIRESIIPRAVKWFTGAPPHPPHPHPLLITAEAVRCAGRGAGEALEDDDEDYEEEGEEEEEARRRHAHVEHPCGGARCVAADPVRSRGAARRRRRRGAGRG